MTDIQKQLADALDLANDLWSKGCTSERLVKACDLLRQQHRRIEALEVELIGLRNVHRQQEERGPLTDEQRIDWLCEEAEFTCGQWQVVIDSDKESFIEAVDEMALRAHGIKGE